MVRVPKKAQCTSGEFRYLALHMHEPARQRARDLANTSGFAIAQRERKKVEALFAELKNQIGLRRLRLRSLRNTPLFLIRYSSICRFNSGLIRNPKNFFRRPARSAFRQHNQENNLIFS